MIYCLNIEDPLESICYRLDNNREWQPCEDPTALGQNDFRTNNRIEILDLQVEDESITIEGKVYKINSTDGVDVLAMEDLSYSVYGFREDYPNPPQRKQLEQVLREGDDSVFNTLVLKSDGQFCLINPEEIIFNKIDPEIIYQFEGFVGGNGYVGPTIEDDNFDDYILDFFRTGIHYWRDHLTKKELHQQSDTFEGNDIDDLLDIYSDLERIKNNY
ncbi:hypothetical protein [Algoriphagus formosus]|uniref:Uncharacterized protein n=1 Tax=Algoriphagus formosus TaxID=2007308 RepID=A0A4R5V1F2_9BACT|nr:hypothetical protein [Algoriphagus aquimaris]TDK45559.1 hypothetical protein E1898_08675 [Algoriphagus aquimaris]